MKKTVLTYGLIAGAILSGMMVITMPFHDAIGFEAGMVIGYTTMVCAFLLIFFGVKSYRESVGGGVMSFGRALAVGSLIMVVASACYVATWEVIYHTYASDYFAKYQAHIMEKARADGETEAEIARRNAEMARYAEMYKNPLWMAAFTFAEPLPVGLIFVVVSAGILRRRRDDSPDGSRAFAA